jgi:hypothetical protein
MAAVWAGELPAGPIVTDERSGAFRLACYTINPLFAIFLAAISGVRVARLRVEVEGSCGGNGERLSE